MNRYNYYKSSYSNIPHINQTLNGAVVLGNDRFEPKLIDPDYLIFKKRRALFSRWSEKLSKNRLIILDIGGRIQPYKPLFEGKLERYYAIDPIFQGLIDAVAVGEYLPFGDDTFDVIICTGTLGYVKNPFQVVDEMHRVLKSGSAIFLDVPSLLPRRHDERWHFLPDGLSILFSQFSHVEIAPECYSIAGIFHTINVCLNLFIKSRLLRRIQQRSLIPLINLMGLMLDRFSCGNSQFTTNYCFFSIK